MIHFLVDQTIEELREWDQHHAADALVSIAAYGRPSDPRYAAIWHTSMRAGGEPARFITESQPTNEPEEAKNVATLAEWQYNISPVLVTATGDLSSHGELGVATTWVYELHDLPGKGGSGTVPTRGLVADTRALLLDELLPPPDASGKQSTEPDGCSSLDVVWYTSIKPNGERGEEVKRFLAVARGDDKTPYDLFEASANNLQLRIADTTFGVMEAPIMKKARGSYMRLHAAIPTPRKKSGYRTTMMHMKRDTYEAWPKKLEKDFACGTITDGPLRRSQLSSNFDERYYSQKLVPLEVRANGVGNDIRFCVTWAKKPKPKTRYFRLWSGAEDAPPQIKLTLQQPRSRSLNALPFPEYSEATNQKLSIMRNAIEARMRDKNISNAQLAIAVNGRLKLVWSLTYGEAGWTLTQPRHKFRFASCAKILTALRAVTLGDDFLNQSLVSALGLPLPILANLSADEFESWSNFYGIRVEDCLRNTSGLTNKYQAIFNAAFEDGRAQLPLAAGDFTLAFQNGAVPKLEVFPARQTEGYCNVGFIAVGEAIGVNKFGDPRGYFDAMSDFWPLDKNLGLVRIVPATKADSFTFGEVPVRAPKAVQTDTYVAETVVTAAGQPPPEYVSGGYGESDASALGPGGGLSMSAATLVRLLQMMHPQGADSPLQGTRLTLLQLLRMHSKQSGTVDRVSDKNAVTSSDRSPRWGLGFRTRFKNGEKAGHFSSEAPHEAEASWGGDFDTGQSGYSHTTYFSPSFGPTQSMSIAFVTNCEQTLQDFNDGMGTWDGAIRYQARSIFDDGGWDNEVDLFPVLNLE